MPFPVDLDVMEYISNSIYYQDEFKSFLENEGMTFDYKEGSELAHVECHGDEDMSIQALLSFLGNIEKRGIVSGQSSVPYVSALKIIHHG